MQAGRVTLGFIGGAQVDRFGNLNTTYVGPRDRALRLPGSGGAPDIASLARRHVVIMAHERRRFVERVDYVTSPGHGDGGRLAGADRTARRRPVGRHHHARALPLRPGDAGDGARERAPGSDRRAGPAETGWPLRLADPVVETPPPSADELAMIRRFDPEGFWTDRAPLSHAVPRRRPRLEGAQPLGRGRARGPAVPAAPGRRAPVRCPPTRRCSTGWPDRLDRARAPDRPRPWASTRRSSASRRPRGGGRATTRSRGCFGRFAASVHSPSAFLEPLQGFAGQLDARCAAADLRPDGARHAGPAGHPRGVPERAPGAPVRSGPAAGAEEARLQAPEVRLQARVGRPRARALHREVRGGGRDAPLRRAGRAWQGVPPGPAARR